MLRDREGLERVKLFIDDIVCFSKTGNSMCATCNGPSNGQRDSTSNLQGTTRRGRNHLPRHKISSEGVDPDPDKVKAIEEMSMPQNVSQMRSLLEGQPLKHGHSAPCYERGSNASSHPTTSASSEKC